MTSLKVRSASLFVLASAFLASGCAPTGTTNSAGPLATGIVSSSESAALPAELPSQEIAQVNIMTENAAPILSKEDYVNAHLSIGATSLNEALDAEMKIRGRGNFTWTLDKKPYRMKLNTAASVLGFPSERDWVLLANHVDKTLARTALAFEISRRVGMAYTPRSEFVDVTLNGEALGSYLLTEHIKSGPSRIAITPMKATDLEGSALTGGYLLELNERMDEDVNWRTARNVAYSLKEPSPAAPAQVSYIQNYIQTAEDVLYSENFADPVEGYAKYIDVDSFINLFLVHEILKNKDAANFGSVYFYKDRDQKLKMGPAWDFDIAAGNGNNSEANNPEGWWLKAYSVWYSRLFQDPAFANRVKEKWNSIKVEKLDTLEPYIDGVAHRLQFSQQKNFSIWKILDVPAFPEVTAKGTYEGEVAYLKQWLRTRIDWMDRQINEKPAPGGDEWIDCADENGQCLFEGTRQVRYGAGDVWVVRMMTAPTSCSNDVFGDPILGVIKKCQVAKATIDQPTEWIHCSDENSRCQFTGPRTVRYGAGTNWVTRVVSDGVNCSNDVFGDPIYGTVKTCQISSTPPVAQWSACSSENEFCNFTGTKSVRYGAGDTWVYATKTDGVDCTNQVFGDPIYGVVKECEISNP